LTIPGIVIILTFVALSYQIKIMKKLLIVFANILSCVIICNAQITDFRGFSWGNSLGKIQSGENDKLLFKSGNDELLYKDILGGSDCEVIYIFNDNDKLTSGMYIFSKKYSNPQLYLQDFNKFKTLLIEKYGNPVSEKETWSNNTPIAEKHTYGQAVADGNLSLNTVWNTERSVIKIVLVTADKHPSLQIHYTTRSLDELENKEELKEAIKKL
jgi:hypothetical protein